MTQWFQKAIQQHKPDNLGGWRKEMPAEKRRADAIDSRPVNWSRSKKYLSAARALQALANVTTDDQTKHAAKQDADYFFKKAKKKITKQYHDGGASNWGEGRLIDKLSEAEQQEYASLMERYKSGELEKDYKTYTQNKKRIYDLQKKMGLRKYYKKGGVIAGFINWLTEDF